MKPTAHIITSLGIGSAIYLIGQSLSAMLVAIFGGIFLDIDHLIDYGLNYGFKPSNFSLKKLCEMGETIKTKRLYLILHSFEFLGLFWLAIFIFKWGIFWFALGLSLTAHMFFDQFLNRTYPFSYFLAFRIIKDFKTEEILKL